MQMRIINMRRSLMCIRKIIAGKDLINVYVAVSHEIVTIETSLTGAPLLETPIKLWYIVLPLSPLFSIRRYN